MSKKYMSDADEEEARLIENTKNLRAYVQNVIPLIVSAHHESARIRALYDGTKHETVTEKSRLLLKRAIKTYMTSDKKFLGQYLEGFTPEDMESIAMLLFKELDKSYKKLIS